MKIIKSKATWLPNKIKFITQLFISIRALFSLPFFKESPNSVKNFFTLNYTKKKDDYIFDGNNDNSYFNQIEKIIPLNELNDEIIVDLGCGNASFYYWLKEHDVNVKKYYGIDFAFNNLIISDNVSIKNISICDYFKSNLSQNVVYILSNSLCYISDDIFKYILNKMNSNDKILIIEPYPNLFWDTHFNGIKPVYRKHTKVIKIMTEKNFIVKNCSIDFVIKIKGIYISPISYSLFAIKR